jgi:hypothetical protein
VASRNRSEPIIIPPCVPTGFLCETQIWRCTQIIVCHNESIVLIVPEDVGLFYVHVNAPMFTMEIFQKCQRMKAEVAPVRLEHIVAGNTVSAHDIPIAAIVVGYSFYRLSLYGFSLYGFSLYGFSLYGFSLYGFSLYGFPLDRISTPTFIG